MPINDRDSVRPADSDCTVTDLGESPTDDEALSSGSNADPAEQELRESIDDHILTEMTIIAESEPHDPVHSIDTEDVPESNDPLRSVCTADGCYWRGTFSDPMHQVAEWNAHIKQVMGMYSDDEAAHHRPEFEVRR